MFETTTGKSDDFLGIHQNKWLIISVEKPYSMNNFNVKKNTQWKSIRKVNILHGLQLFLRKKNFISPLNSKKKSIVYAFNHVRQFRRNCLKCSSELNRY